MKRKTVKRRTTKSGSKIKNAKKATFDGIPFDSGLELFAYKTLKAEGINDFTREGWKIPLLDAFVFNGTSMEVFSKTDKVTKSKVKILKQATNKIRAITWSPDFVSVDKNKKKGWVMECKGWANENYPLKRKMFKNYLVRNNYNVDLFEPNNIENVIACVKLIKSKYYK